jgi:nicotinamide riboside transporter PnuC
MRYWPIIIALPLAIAVGWLVNITAWPWQAILHWSGGLSALAVVGVTLHAMNRERLKRPFPEGDSLSMFIAILALLILTLSMIANFLLFVVSNK